MFGWREVFMTFSAANFDKVCKELEQNKVRYRYCVRNMIGPNSSAGTFGTELIYDKQFLMTVKNKDADMAQYLIKNVLRG